MQRSWALSYQLQGTAPRPRPDCLSALRALTWQVDISRQLTFHFLEGLGLAGFAAFLDKILPGGRLAT